MNTLSALGRPASVGAAFLLLSLSANAAIVEVGDLNVIDDPGNASDGLRFLDMTYSDGLSQTAALTNAQNTYANARLATVSEFDDLYAATGVVYSGSLTASDVFATGGTEEIATPQMALNEIRDALGPTTSTPGLNIWSDPDGSTSFLSTRDYLFVGSSSSSSRIIQTGTTTSSDSVGWLIVSEASAVPLPAAGWLFMSALVGLVGKKQLSRR